MRASPTRVTVVASAPAWSRRSTPTPRATWSLTSPYFSTSVLSTPAIDVDLHVILARPLSDVVTATTFVRVAFHEERIAVDLFVCERQVASDADAPALAAAQALAMRRNPASCREFIRQA